MIRSHLQIFTKAHSKYMNPNLKRKTISLTCHKAEYFLCFSASLIGIPSSLSVQDCSNIPAVDITNNMFFNDSGMASNWKKIRDTNSMQQK